MDHSETTPLEQASAIPYRLRDGQPEFCLITSISTGKWGFPKGIVDPGETPEETAIKEALPEITEVLDVTDHAQGNNPYYQG